MAQIYTEIDFVGGMFIAEIRHINHDGIEDDITYKEISIDEQTEMIWSFLAYHCDDSPGAWCNCWHSMTEAAQIATKDLPSHPDYWVCGDSVYCVEMAD